MLPPGRSEPAWAPPSPAAASSRSSSPPQAGARQPLRPRTDQGGRAMNARAAVLYEVRKPVVVEDVELLEPGSQEVQVRWVANGVCHSDLHVITGDYPHPLPVILGHEAAGGGEKGGAGVETGKPGGHVCSRYIPSGGRCGYCIGGQPTMCALRDKPRWFMLDGTPRFRKGGHALHHFLQVSGYATHAVLPEQSVIPIRKDVPLDLACLVSCGVVAGAGPGFNPSKVPPGATVPAFGGVGVNTSEAGRMVGGGKLLAVDVNPQKLAWAEEFGASHIVDAAKEDPVARVQALSGMGGVDFAFEVVGTQKTIEQALASTHRGGTCVVVGVSPAGTRLSIDPGMLL